jgi:hypothetical protein
MATMESRDVDAKIAVLLGWLSVKKFCGQWIGQPPKDPLGLTDAESVYLVPMYTDMIDGKSLLTDKTWMELKDAATMYVIKAFERKQHPAQTFRPGASYEVGKVTAEETNEQGPQAQSEDLQGGWENKTPQGHLIRAIDQLTCVIQEAHRDWVRSKR